MRRARFTGQGDPSLLFTASGDTITSVLPSIDDAVSEPGCGKTTLARALLHATPATGKVLFGGKDLLTMGEPELRVVPRELVQVTAFCRLERRRRSAIVSRFLEA